MAWGTKAGAADWCRRLQDNDKTLTATGDALDGPSTAPLNFNRPLVVPKTVLTLRVSHGFAKLVLQ